MNLKASGEKVMELVRAKLLGAKVKVKESRVVLILTILSAAALIVCIALFAVWITPTIARNKQTTSAPRTTPREPPVDLDLYHQRIGTAEKLMASYIRGQENVNDLFHFVRSYYYHIVEGAIRPLSFWFLDSHLAKVIEEYPNNSMIAKISRSNLTCCANHTYNITATKWLYFSTLDYLQPLIYNTTMYTRDDYNNELKYMELVRRLEVSIGDVVGQAEPAIKPAHHEHVFFFVRLLNFMPLH